MATFKWGSSTFGSTSTFEGPGIIQIVLSGGSTSSGTLTMLVLYRLVASGASSSSGALSGLLEYVISGTGSSTSSGSFTGYINRLINGSGSSISSGALSLTQRYRINLSGSSSSSGSLNLFQHYVRQTPDTLPGVTDFTVKNLIFTRVISETIPSLLETITLLTSHNRPLAPICVIVSITIT